MPIPPDEHQQHRPFLPEAPSPLFIKAAQELVHEQLLHQNQLHISDQALSRLAALPAGAGVILTPNHADETDPRVCIELSHHSNKQFVSMCNREAFDELFGLAGFVLRKLGHFSIERGAHDQPALDHAVDIVRQGDKVLVIFPEGEIFYLNEKVQNFHAGAVEIGMQALAKRGVTAGSSIFILPMAIKYHYAQPISDILERRVFRMENTLLIPHTKAPLTERLFAIQNRLLHDETTKNLVPMQLDETSPLSQRVQELQKAVIAGIQARHSDLHTYQKQIIDQTLQLEAELRETLAHTTDKGDRASLQKDLDALKEMAQLTSWRPSYYREDPTDDRLAEALMKIERELYRIKRPKQLAPRMVSVDIAEPIDLSLHKAAYDADPKAARHELTEDLHAKVQGMVDKMIIGYH